MGPRSSHAHGRVQTDPADARARLVTVTEKGHELVALSAPVVAAIEAEWRNRLGPVGFDQLRDLPHRAPPPCRPRLRNRDAS